MLTCKDLNIELCNACRFPENIGVCSIVYWKIQLSRYFYTDNHLINTIITNYISYKHLYKAIELYKPKLAAKISKLLILK
jgi:hypothetical protein